MPQFTGISHLLLDIEGTTCPVSFVAETLFPYAAASLPAFLRDRQHDPQVQQLVDEAERAWTSDSDPEARLLLRRWQQGQMSTGGTGSARWTGVEAFLQLLIRQDRKLTALKELQGLVWQAGYASGDLVAPLFSDVPVALQRWSEQGLQLAVYSSGSVAAQQLLYRHTHSGNLQPLFSHWFDTRTGAKQDADSYSAISRAMEVAPERVLFVSDALGELRAARRSGMAVLFSDRPGNPQRDAGEFERIGDYNDLVLAR